jgi:hypothetical protein
MKIVRVTRSNFGDALVQALQECRSQLQNIGQEPPHYALRRELGIAIQALEGIDKEIREGKQRPKGQRPALFLRYVVDEGERMVMDAHLKELIGQIEDVYKRYGGL